MSSTFGEKFRVTTWGESHGAGIGVVIDGCPSGLEFDKEFIEIMLRRRKPQDFTVSTPRVERDDIEVLSGVFEGKTLGTPISIFVRNQAKISKDYSNIKDCYRPGHADYGYDAKYGFRDYRGGGRSSGRETVARVIGGAVAQMILKRLGIEFLTFTESIGEIFVTDENFDVNEINKNSLFMPSRTSYEEAMNYINHISSEGDSTGGMIQCIVKNVMPGIGEPVFDKLDAVISKAVMSIGAVKAVEIGDGIEAAVVRGSDWNDPFVIRDGKVGKESNNAGGILGGISDGSSIKVRTYIKPTPSISIPQNTVDKAFNPVEIEIKGRHDCCIVPRCCVVVESMIAISIVDMILQNMSTRIEYVEKIYK